MNSPADDAFAVKVTEEQLDIRRETVDTGRPLRLRKQVEDVPVVVREPLDIETVQRGNCVVVADAQDERARQWRAEGWTGSPQGADSGRSDTRMRDDAPPVGQEGVMDLIQQVAAGERSRQGSCVEPCWCATDLALTTNVRNTRTTAWHTTSVRGSCISAG